MLGPFSVDEFCALLPIQNIDEAIAQAEQRLTAMQQAETVRATQHFDPFEPPTIDTDEIQALLRKVLSDIDSQALQAVQSHIQHLGQQGETWISKGMEFVNSASQVQPCPFCNQPLSDSDLINHYRSYFSRTYATHKDSINAQLNEVNRILGENAFMQFSNLITQQSERHRFWAQFIPLGFFSVDMSQITNAWQALRSNLVRLLKQNRNPSWMKCYLMRQLSRQFRRMKL